MYVFYIFLLQTFTSFTQIALFKRTEVYEAPGKNKEQSRPPLPSRTPFFLSLSLLTFTTTDKKNPPSPHTMEICVLVRDTGDRFFIEFNDTDTVEHLKRKAVDAAMDDSTGLGGVHLVLGDVSLADHETLRDIGISGTDELELCLTGDEGLAAPFTYRGHTDCVESACLSPSAHRLYTASHDSTIRVWDTVSGECLSILSTTPGRRVTSCALSPCGTHLFTGGEEQTVRVWCTATGTCLKELVGHGQWVTSIAVAPSGAELFTGSGDRTVRVWSLDTYTCIKKVDEEEKVFVLTVSPCGQHLFVGMGTGSIVVRSAHDYEKIADMEGHVSKVTAICVGEDQVYTSSCDSSIRVWDGSTFEQVNSVTGHHYGWVTGLALCSRTSRLYSCGQDARVCVWDTDAHDFIGVLGSNTAWLTNIVTSPRGGYVFACATAVKVERAEAVKPYLR